MKQEEEMGGFLIPKEMIPMARKLAGSCAKCGHELELIGASEPDIDGVMTAAIAFYNEIKCKICGHKTTDEMPLEDVEDYDNKRNIDPTCRDKASGLI